MQQQNIRGIQRRQRILAFVTAYTAEHGFPPSVRDITAGVGLASTSTTDYHLSVLADQSKVSRTPSSARTIEVL